MMKSFMRAMKNILLKNQRFKKIMVNTHPSVECVTDLVEQFRVGVISLDEMWNILDDIFELHAEDFIPAFDDVGHISYID